MGIRDICVRAIGSLLVIVLVSAPLSLSAASNAQTIVPAAAAGVGAGLLLGQMLNNSANNACKSCQNTDATKPNYCKNITCSVTTNGFSTNGHCGAPGECRAETAQGLNGSSISLGTVLQVVGLVATLAQLAQQQNAASMPAPAAPMPYQYGGCATYYSVTTPSSDPCAIYNPTPVSDKISQTPISDFGGSGAISGGSIADQLIGLTNGTGGGSAGLSASSSAMSDDLARLAGFAPGASSSAAIAASDEETEGTITSSIREGNFGATFIANIKQGVAEIAGFFGTNVPDAKNQPFLGRFCAARSWANGWIAKILPLSFFDSLCMRLGFQVGIVEETGVAPQQGFVQETRPASAAQSVKALAAPAEADIWAEPASVRLGTRTKIFWRSANTESCRVSGPSFEQDSLAGGGTTVPITGPTVFTIRCDVVGGEPVSDSVTVNLAI